MRRICKEAGIGPKKAAWKFEKILGDLQKILGKTKAKKFRGHGAQKTPPPFQKHPPL